MDLSIIIVTRNTCTLACAAIESVLNSRDDLTREIFLVDNGSTDETPEVVARRFPAVHYLRSAQNLGFARANNWAAREAQGRFLLLLNSDAALPPDALPVAVNWLRAHPDCGVCGAQLLNPDGSRQNSIANFPTLATEMLNKSLLRRLWPSRFPGKEHVFAEPVEVQSIVGAFVLTRKDLWDQLGGLDEDYFFFLEETDFCLRARKAGLRVMHLPQVRVRHEQGGSAGSLRTAARIEYWRSRYIYFHKHHGRGVRLALQIGLAARLLVDTLSSGLMTIFSLGCLPRWRQKFASYRALVAWHWLGRPDNRGLPR